MRVAWLVTAILTFDSGTGQAQVNRASWLDQPKPVSWNRPGLPIPDAPRIQGTIDGRCRELARPAELEEDKRLQEHGWGLGGDYQGGWQIVVIRGTASYDGMCRPRQYQAFVFVRGVFVGTLSPDTMDSRTDGALGLVYLQNRNRLAAEYARYAAADPLCCPSRTTRVEFNLGSGVPVLRPVSTYTSTRR